MGNNKYKTDKELIDIVDKAYKEGIFIPCNIHPCGWDFVSFVNLKNNLKKEEDILNYCFESKDISGGIYISHPFIGLTLNQVLSFANNEFKYEIDIEFLMENIM